MELQEWYIQTGFASNVVGRRDLRLCDIVLFKRTLHLVEFSNLAQHQQLAFFWLSSVEPVYYK